MHKDAIGDAAKKDRQAKNRDRVRRWVRARQAQGRCRCGRRITETSKGRCLLCLERERMWGRRRRGIMTAGRRRRGRPIIGSLGDRRREFKQEERHREWRQEQQAERRRKRRLRTAPVAL